MSEIQKQITEQGEPGKQLIRQPKTREIPSETIGKDIATPVVITYKDRIFRMIFKDRKELLMLYNAMMDNCKTLYGYAVSVDLVRRQQKTENSLKTAVSKAIEECIENDILSDFLKANKAEVLKMSIYEYDEAKQMQFEREEGWQAGLDEGRQTGIKNLIETSQELNSSCKDTIKRVCQKYSLSEDEAQKYVEQYWEQ